MKKIRTFVYITFIIGIILMPSKAYAWDDCPKGMVDDPYPGECARYIDTDNDGICDRSQPAPEDREVPELLNIEKPAELPTQNQDNSPISKLLPVIGVVLFHLAVILLYVAYRKSKRK